MGVYIIYEYKKNIEREAFRFSMNSLVAQYDQNICLFRLKRPGKVSLLDTINLKKRSN